VSCRSIHTRDNSSARANAAIGGIVVIGVYLARTRNKNGFTISSESNAMVQLYTRRLGISLLNAVQRIEKSYIYTRFSNQSFVRVNADIEVFAIIENDPPHTLVASLGDQKVTLGVDNKVSRSLQTGAKEFELHAITGRDVELGSEVALCRGEANKSCSSGEEYLC
jgi:hypothetical protein